MEHNPHEQVELCGEVMLQNFRSSRRGAAAGPSGVTGAHLRVVLDSESDSDAFTAFARTLAVCEVPHEIMKAIRLGRMTALRKPDGGVRCIVVGDFLRRLVARTLAQQFSKAVLEATAPFQFVLSTKAGIEAVTHALQALTSLDEDGTVVSIDGVGAFDLISRNAMVSVLMAMGHGDTLWPFVRQFYGQPSSYLWEDDCGITHDIRQGEGGEQGDPPMPLLFSLGLHKSLTSVSDRLLASERIFAFLDDIYLVCHPEQVEAVYEIVRQELRRHANIDIHSGKTKIWNRSRSVDRASTSARPRRSCVEGNPGHSSLSTRHEGARRAFRTG